MILHTSTLAKIKLHIKLKTKCNKHYIVEKIKPVAGQTTAEKKHHKIHIYCPYFIYCLHPTCQLKTHCYISYL